MATPAKLATPLIVIKVPLNAFPPSVVVLIINETMFKAEPKDYKPEPKFLCATIQFFILLLFSSVEIESCYNFTVF